MDLKTLKKDLTYCCKKLDKVLSTFGDNLSISDEFKFVAEGKYLDPLEALILIKGFVPTKEQQTIYTSKHYDEKTQQLTIRNVPHWTAFNLSIVDVLIEQAELSRADLYAFLDGFENVLGCGNEKTEAYQLGVYIREKFTPVEARVEPLKSLNNYVYRVQDSKTSERMFVVYTRKGETSIVEAECYVLTSMDDPGIRLLPPGEFRGLVTAPEILFEKKIDGSIGPAVYHSHSLHREYGDALKEAQSLIEKEFAFRLRKYKQPYTDADVAAAFLAIKLIKLPNSTFLTPSEELQLKVSEVS